MKEQIRKLVKLLQLCYGIFIVFSLGVYLIYETGVIQEGRYAAEPQMQYVLNTIGILLAMTMIPLSLKMFSLIMEKRIRRTSLSDAMKLYLQWSVIRVLLFALAVIPNIIIYFLTLDNTGGLCALLGVTASLFCLPTEKRIMHDLDITNNVEIW